MRVLITGAGGQLAADLTAVFAAAGYEVHGRKRQELDVGDAMAVRAALEAVRPDIILNPAACTLMDDAEKEPAVAFATNALGPRALAQGAAAAGLTLVHFSTDYVFAGNRRTPYNEEDAPQPLSVYAASKLAGECFVRVLAPRHYVLRVCGLFGLAGRSTHRGNFVEAMLRAATAGRPLRVVADQIVAPTATTDVARATLALLERAAPYGLYHCTAAGETSWYDYACAIFDLAGMAVDVSATTAAGYCALARRPAYSILDNSKLRSVGVAQPRHWRPALADYLARRRECVAVK